MPLRPRQSRPSTPLDPNFAANFEAIFKRDILGEKEEEERPDVPIFLPAAARVGGGIISSIVGAIPGPVKTPLAGGVGVLTELLAQKLEGAQRPGEGREGFNKEQVAVQAGLSAVPFGRTASLVKRLLRASGFGAVGAAGTELAERQSIVPTTETLKRGALGGAVGVGLVGGGNVLGRVLGMKAARAGGRGGLPSATDEPLTGRVLPERRTVPAIAPRPQPPVEEVVPPAAPPAPTPAPAPPPLTSTIGEQVAARTGEVVEDLPAALRTVASRAPDHIKKQLFREIDVGNFNSVAEMERIIGDARLATRNQPFMNRLGETFRDRRRELKTLESAGADTAIQRQRFRKAGEALRQEGIEADARKGATPAPTPFGAEKAGGKLRNPEARLRKLKVDSENLSQRIQDPNVSKSAKARAVKAFARVQNEIAKLTQALTRPTGPGGRVATQPIITKPPTRGLSEAERLARSGPVPFDLLSEVDQKAALRTAREEIKRRAGASVPETGAEAPPTAAVAPQLDQAQAQTQGGRGPARRPRGRPKAKPEAVSKSAGIDDQRAAFQKVIDDPDTPPLIRDQTQRELDKVNEATTLLSRLKSPRGALQVDPYKAAFPAVGAGVGAVGGALSADDPADRSTNAIIGALMGAGLGAGVASRLSPQLLKGASRTEPIPAMKQVVQDLLPKASTVAGTIDQVHFTSLLSSPVTILKAVGGAYSGAMNHAVEISLDNPVAARRLIARMNSSRYWDDFIGAMKRPKEFIIPGRRGLESEKLLASFQPNTRILLSFPQRIINAADTAAVRAMMEETGLRIDDAARLTLAGEPTTELMQGLVKTISGNFWGRRVFPFVRVGTQVLERGLERSPLGLSAGVRKGLGTTPVSANVTKIRVALGTAATVGGFFADPVLSDLNESLGVPEELTPLIAAVTGPLALNTFVGLTARKALNRGEDVLGTVVNEAVDEVLPTGGRGDTISTLARIPSGMVASLLRDFSRGLDPVERRETRIGRLRTLLEENEDPAFLDKLMATRMAAPIMEKIPGIRELLPERPPVVDIFGETGVSKQSPLTKFFRGFGAEQGFSPMKAFLPPPAEVPSTKLPDTPLGKLLEDIDFPLGVPDASLSNLPQGRELSVSEETALRMGRGQNLRIAFEDFLEEHPEFPSLPPEQQVRILKIIQRRTSARTTGMAGGAARRGELTLEDILSRER